ncbi:MAG: hypothetical protein SWY16_05450 [Cyanobacteriota bacterium]|nr:hypothetical protein [Cyanobacteriota bacterium]
MGKRQLVDLLFTLLSFERAVGSIGHLTVLSDGSLDAKDVEFFQQWHEKSQVFLNPEELCQAYHYSLDKTLLRFSTSYYLAPKVLLANVVQSRSNCLLLDSDMIFFQNPLTQNGELSKAIESERSTCLEDEVESFDPDIWRCETSKNRSFSKKVNSGLVYVPHGAFDRIDWQDRIPEKSIENPHIFAEQSVIAAGLEAVTYSFLPRSKFLVSLRGTGFPKGDYLPFCDIETSYRALVCRHFVTPVRYLMWLKAFPLLKNDLKLARSTTKAIADSDYDISLR